MERYREIESVLLVADKSCEAGIIDASCMRGRLKSGRLLCSLRSRLLHAVEHCYLGGAMMVIFETQLVELFSRSALALLLGSWSGMKEKRSAYLFCSPGCRSGF
jgi:hypothetical protein